LGSMDLAFLIRSKAATFMSRIFSLNSSCVT
jgi:hypothetical protein